MWHQDVLIRQQAALFVKERYLDTIVSKVAGDSEIQAQLRLFLRMVVDSPHRHVPNYAVDALWPQWRQKKKHIFKDWKAMTDLLLFDLDHNKLSNDEQTTLCRILSLSCRKALGESICPKQKGERPSRESAVCLSFFLSFSLCLCACVWTQDQETDGKRDTKRAYSVKHQDQSRRNHIVLWKQTLRVAHKVSSRR